MVHICKMIVSLGVFYFFKILILQIVSGVKEQKMTQNDRKLSVSLRISGTVRHMILIFGTHM